MTTPYIEGYRFGRIVVDGRAYDRDLILTPDEVFSNWWRDEGHSLSPRDLDKALTANPEVLVIGMGSLGLMKVPVETSEYLQAAGIEVIAQSTSAACETYNHLSREKRVVAALHLTC